MGPSSSLHHHDAMFFGCHSYKAPIALYNANPHVESPQASSVPGLMYAAGKAKPLGTQLMSLPAAA